MNRDLRAEFPLSPRKFWKKIIEKFIVVFVLSCLLTVPVTLVLYADLELSMALVTTIVVAAPFLITALLLGIYGIYVHYYIKFYYYSENTNFLAIKKGVFMPTEINVQYLKMQDVFVDQDLLDRIMGLYDVHISSATASSGMEAHIDGVDKKTAEGLKSFFLDKIHKETTFQRQGLEQSNENSQVAQTTPAVFSTKISSETYGLGKEWWLGEIVKIALGSVFVPLVAVIWFAIKSAPEDSSQIYSLNWSHLFYVWIGVFVFYVLYRAIYLFLWQSHYKYEFGSDYIYMKIGILSISEKNMGYNTIQDVKIKQGIVDRIFGVADLIIENASPGVPNIYNNKQQRLMAPSGIVIEGLEISDAKKISEELKIIISNKRTILKGL